MLLPEKQHQPGESLPIVDEKPVLTRRTHSWELICEDVGGVSGVQAPKPSYAVLPGLRSDAPPPEPVCPDNHTRLLPVTEPEEGHKLYSSLEDRQEVDEQWGEDGEEFDSNVKGAFEHQGVQVPLTIVEQKELYVKEDHAQAIGEDYELIACATAAAEFSGLASTLVLGHSGNVHRGLVYQPSMEEVADEEQGGVIAVEKQEQVAPIHDWTTSNTNSPRINTFRDAGDEFPALSRWQKKSTLLTQQQHYEQEEQRRNALIRRNRLISYPSDSTMASTAASEGTVTDGHAQSLNWDDTITSSQSVSRRASIVDSGVQDEDIQNSGQVTPSELTPTPSTIAPYISNSSYGAHTNPAPTSGNTWGRDSGIGDDYLSRLSYSQSSVLDDTLVQLTEPAGSFPKRRDTFDSTFNRGGLLQHSPFYDSSATHKLSADDSEITDARKRRLRRKQERGAPLSQEVLLTREETICALQNRPKSAFDEKVNLFNKLDAQELFPVPEGTKTRSISPTHDLTVRRGLFDQPPMPIHPSEAIKGLKRATTWGPGRKKSAPELSTAAISSPTFAPPEKAATFPSEPARGKSPTSQLVVASPPLSPPSPPPADIDEEIDNDPANLLPPSSAGASMQLDFGHIPKTIPVDTGSWGKKLGKYFRGPGIGFFDKSPQTPSEVSRVGDSLDDVVAQKVIEEQTHENAPETSGNGSAQQIFQSPSLQTGEASTPEEQGVLKVVAVPIPITAESESESTQVEPETHTTATGGAQPQTITTTPSLITAQPTAVSGASKGNDGSSSWADYFAGIRHKMIQAGAQAAAQAAGTPAEIPTSSPATDTSIPAVNRDLASESAEFVRPLVDIQSPSQLPELSVWRNVQGEARDDVKTIEEARLRTQNMKVEDVKLGSVTASPEATKESTDVEDGETHVLEPDYDEEDDDDIDMEKHAREVLAGVLLEPILEESEEEYEDDEPEYSYVSDQLVS